MKNNKIVPAHLQGIAIGLCVGVTAGATQGGLGMIVASTVAFVLMTASYILDRRATPAHYDGKRNCEKDDS